jgi:lipopolysaccharide export system protein LptA
MRQSHSSIGRGGGAVGRLDAAVLLLSFLLASPAAAQTPKPPPAGTQTPASPTATANQPVQIQAVSGIEWDQNAHLYIARGNAVAIRGPSAVHADTLIAHYRDVKSGGNVGGKTEIYRVDAEGHVVLQRGDDTVFGDHAVYDVDQGVSVVTGKHLKMTTPTDVVTARDSFEWYDAKSIAVARGDAVAIRNNSRTVKADILTAYMHKTAPGGKPGQVAAKPAPLPISTSGGISDPNAEKISRVDAQGHVVVSNPVETGRGDFGVYNEDTGLATLLGNVVIERGKDVLTGQRGVMDLNRNLARMLPGGTPGHHRVEGLFVRDQQHPGAAPHPPGTKRPPPAGSTR